MDSGLLIKIVGVLLLANAVYATLAHRANTLTIYVDWTDAAITALSPVIALALWGIAVFFHVPDRISRTAGVLCFYIFMYYGLRLTWEANKSPTAFLSAAAAKYTMLLSFYALFAMSLVGSERRKYERTNTWARRDAITLAAVVGGYLWWSSWVARSPRFTPIENWFAGDSADLLDSANDDSAAYATVEE